MAQQMANLIEIREGAIIQHKKGGLYVIEDPEAYFSEATDVYPVLSPFEMPYVGYRALYGERKKWFRPRSMFTQDRFRVVDVDTPK